MTDGVFDRDGTFERFTFFDTGLIERLFRAEVLRMLTGKGLISQDVVENLMSWPHSGFSAHPEGPVSRWDVYELIARVLDHLPPPRHQLVRYWGYYSNVSRGKRRAAARRLAAAVDPDDDSLCYASVATTPVATDAEPFRRRARLTWAALIKRVYELDPLLCPFLPSDPSHWRIPHRFRRSCCTPETPARRLFPAELCEPTVANTLLGAFQNSAGA